MDRKLLLSANIPQQLQVLLNKSGNLTKWLCLVLLFVANFGYGQTNTWNGSSSTAWNTPGNWSLNAVPVAANNVVIPNAPRQPSITSNSPAAVCNNLTINSGAILTVTANNTFRVNGDSSITGTLILAGTGTKTFTGNVIINPDGTWNETGAATINYSGNLQNDGTYIANTGSHTFNANNKIISGAEEIGIPNLTINNPTTNNAILTVSTSLGGSTNLTNTRVLNFGGTSIGTNLTLTATAANNTVNYIGAGQAVKETTYFNLILSGSGTKTFTIGTPSDNLTIASGVIANLGIYTSHNTKVLTLGGLTSSSGTWGNSNSTALYKNDVFFTNGNSARGVINVGNNCTLPLLYTVNGGGVVCSNTAGSVIGLSDSEIGVNYQLFRGNVAVGSVAAGTGNAISFGSFNITGNYTVVAMNASTQCALVMTGSANVFSYSSPPLPSVTITNASCPTDASGAIKVTNLAAPASLAFTGANKQYVDFGTPMLSGRSSFTVEGWIKFDKTKYTERMSLFGQNDVIEFGFEGNNLRCWTANGGSVDLPMSSYPGDNGWHHVALVGTGSGLVLYLDGVSKATSTNSTISSYGSSIYTAKIGFGVMDDLNAGTAFTGEVFRLGFWNKALTSTEILNMSKGFVVYDASQNGLLAGYNFNEGTGNTISGVGSISSSSQGVFKGITGVPIWTDPYKYAWTSPSGYTSSSKDISNLLPGTYNLTTSLNTCTSIGSWEVKANAIQTITTSGTINAVCFGTQTKATLPYSASTGNLTSYSINWNAAANTAGLLNQASTAFAFATNGGNVNTITIPVSLAANTYSGIMTITNGTCSQTQAVSLTVNSLPTAPTVGVVTHPTCVVTTGSIALSGLIVGGTLKQTGFVNKDYSITTSSMTISLLASGTYQFAVDNGTCTSTATAGITVNPQPAVATYTTAGGWSSTPTIEKSIVFANNYNSQLKGVGAAGNLEGCSCTVNSGVNVTINSGATLTITNSVTVNSALNTSLTFENTASLVQTTNASNSGDIIYKRISSPMKALDYTYWSSPVLGQKLNVLSPNSDPNKFYMYNNGWQAIGASSPMDVGKGYIIRVPKAGTWPGETVSYPYAQPVAFKGVPNNGAIQGETVTAGNVYLVGNPYPSAIDADKFILNVTNNAIIKGTLYFWTHNTAIEDRGSQGYTYTSDDYASYNITGSTVTKESAISSGNKDLPTGKIAAGQSFMLESRGAGTIVFNNEMRIAGENNQFFRPSKTAKASGIEKNRVWLNLINNEGAFKQILVGYIEGATNGEDNNFDGAAFNLNSFIDFYSINDEQNYSIQGRALPFTDTDMVPLGYSSKIKGDFTIEIDNADGVLANQVVYLEDKLKGTIHDLTQKGYTFTTAIGTFDDRFVLRYTNKTLGTGEFETDENAILVAVANKEIKINAISQAIDKVFIYDVTGKLIYKKDKVANPKLVIENLKSSNQVLLVKVVLDNKHTETKKIIF